MPDTRPNVLLFTTDQHRGDHLSIAGHPIVETPNADAFVNRGAYFPNAYTEISSTTGARRCMLGGQGSHACGYVGYGATEWHERNTVAQVLADAGYHCIDVGWRNLRPARKLYGFHTVIPHELHSLETDDYLVWLKREVGPAAQELGHGLDYNGWTARPWHLDERYHPTVWTTDVAIDQLAKRDPTRPFFMWCSHLRPHSPYDPPRDWWDIYARRDLPPVSVGDWAAAYDIPNPGLDITATRGRLTDEQSRRMRAAYMATVAHLDAELGRLLRFMRDTGIYDDTLVIFVSDHGDMQGDHNLFRKTYAYEGSARIVFLVRWPRGLDAPSGTFAHPVGLQDVMPTALEVAGVPIPASVTGSSVLGALRGEPWREFIHGEHSPCYTRDEANHFLTDGREKYVWLPASATERFFDLTSDRIELRDLSRDPACRERVTLWRRRLVTLLAERGDGFSDGTRLLRRTDWWSPIVGDPSLDRS